MKSKLLNYLRTHIGQLVSKRQIVRDVWDDVIDWRKSRSLDQYVCALRKQGFNIDTKHGLGLVFREDNV